MRAGVVIVGGATILAISSGMLSGHQIGRPMGDTVVLEVRTLDTHQQAAIPSVPVTREKRKAIWKQRNESAAATR